MCLSGKWLLTSRKRQLISKSVKELYRIHDPQHRLDRKYLESFADALDLSSNDLVPRLLRKSHGVLRVHACSRFETSVGNPSGNRRRYFRAPVARASAAAVALHDIEFFSNEVDYPQVASVYQSAGLKNRYKGSRPQ